MSIPQDLDSKLASLRSRITLLVDHWTRVCSTYDRIAHRRENQGADWARLQVALEGAVEEEGRGWRAGEVLGVERETETVAKRAGRAGELLGTSAAKTLDTTVEELKRVSALRFLGWGCTDVVPVASGTVCSLQGLAGATGHAVARWSREAQEPRQQELCSRSSPSLFFLLLD